MTTKKLLTIGFSSLLLTSVASAKGNKKTFAEADTNNDGQVSEAEYILGAKKETKAKKRFKKKDKDADGFLSQKEFERKRKKKGPKKCPKKKKGA